jgi:hypothetical protein
LSSSFTLDRQTQLDVLFDKLQRTRELSDMEWKTAGELAQYEKEYLRSLQATAADLGVSTTGNESSEALLNAIAVARKAEISRTTTGTAGERNTASELGRLKTDVQNGITFKDAIQRYGSELSTSQIRATYNQYSRYNPATESEAEVQQWLIKPKVGESSADKTAQYLSQVNSYGSREEALRDFEIYKDIMRAEGVNPQTILDAINKKFPSSEESTWFEQQKEKHPDFFENLFKTRVIT